MPDRPWVRAEIRSVKTGLSSQAIRGVNPGRLPSHTPPSLQQAYLAHVAQLPLVVQRKLDRPPGPVYPGQLPTPPVYPGQQPRPPYGRCVDEHEEVILLSDNFVLTLRMALLSFHAESDERQRRLPPCLYLFFLLSLSRIRSWLVV
ncbi:hypothetical protein V8E53_012319 [Lactarius tabidus]